MPMKYRWAMYGGLAMFLALRASVRNPESLGFIFNTVTGATISSEA